MHSKIFILFFSLLIFKAKINAQRKILGAEKEGLCSFYSKKFDDFPTSNGEKYDRNAYTAAHKTLPLNTLVAVTNLINNKYVIVRINDRGPHRKTRLIDISEIAAQDIGITRLGIAKVNVKVVGFDNFQYLDAIDPLGNLAEIRNEK